MSDGWDSPGSPDQLIDFPGRNGYGRDICWSLGSDVSFKGLLRGFDITLPEHDEGQVGSSQATPSGYLFNLGDVHGVTESGEFLCNICEPLDRVRPSSYECLTDFFLTAIGKVPEDMDFVLFQHGRHLDAGDKGK